MASVHDSIVRKHLMSEKEKSAKDRLFKKGGPGNKRQGNQAVPDEVAQTVRKQPADANLDKQIEGFMKEMTAEVKKINAGKTMSNPDAVSREMVHHQNEVLLNHAQLMNENQQVIKQLLKKDGGRRAGPSADQTASTAVIQELLKPLQSQIEEVRKIYDDTRNQANDVNECLNLIKKSKKLDLNDQPKQEKDFTDKFDNYLVVLVYSSRPTVS